MLPAGSVSLVATAFMIGVEPIAEELLAAEDTFEEELVVAEAPMDSTALSESRGAMHSETLHFGGLTYQVIVDRLLDDSTIDVLTNNATTVGAEALINSNQSVQDAQLQNGFFDPFLLQRTIVNAQDGVEINDGLKVDVHIPNFDQVNDLHQAASVVSTVTQTIGVLSGTGN